MESFWIWGRSIWKMIVLVHVALVEWMDHTMVCRVDSLAKGKAAPGGNDNGSAIQRSSNESNICGENGKWMENGNLCLHRCARWPSACSRKQIDPLCITFNACFPSLLNILFRSKILNNRHYSAELCRTPIAITGVVLKEGSYTYKYDSLEGK